MTSTPSILAFAGSARRESCNAKVLNATIGLVEKAGAHVTRIDWPDYDMPLYHGDFEAEHGIPDPARRFKREMIAHDGFLIASPEYNSSVTPLLKNAIDWASRGEPDDPHPLVAYRGKTAALIGASPGRLGGLRALAHLRQLLSNIGVLVIPDQVAVPHANQAFGDDGTFSDAGVEKMLTEMAERLVAVTARLKAG